MKNIKHIFFDLDNTLWDYRRNAEIAVRKVYLEFGIEKEYGYGFDEFYNHYYEVNESLWEKYRNAEITRPELQSRRFPESFKNLGIQNPDFAVEFELRFMAEVSDGKHLVPNAIEILEYLKGKYHIHVITNGFPKTTDYKINNSILKDFVETVVTAESAGAPKPNPKAFSAGLRESGAELSESVYIGDDWEADIVGATEFGMKAIFFNPLAENHLWIEGVPVVDQLTEIKNYL